MEYRLLGNCGVRVSVIGLGTNRFGSEAVPQAEVDRMIDAAADLGINFIDTADSYGDGRSEEMIGQALKGRWSRFVVATKFYFPTGGGPNDRGASRYHMMNALDASLRRLKSDHVDLYYIHRWDESTPIDETLRALDDVVRMGKVRYVGCSAFAAWQLAHSCLLAETRGWSRPVVIQAAYNMLERGAERELLPYCRAHNVGFVPYYPLAGGFLTGKYKPGQPPPPGSRGETSRQVRQFMKEPFYRKIEKLGAWAQARSRGLNELAEAWLLAQPRVCSVISGATRLEHVLSNARAGDWALTAEELREIDSILNSGDTMHNS
ncbi:MAG TPA: aldo/keto reductase [Candidatus Acidoferrales bacterium]|nr:aldo/keto reductase [Candidatus Acidoferrales bacterium]